jgi:iron complex outermembrane receptor protein
MGVSAFALTPFAMAQDNEVDTESEMLLEEVIVTATKRDENLQTVAGSLNVLTSQVLQEMSVQKMEDLALLAPSVTYIGSGKGGSAQFYIGGVTDGGNGNLGASTPSSAMYLDESPVTLTGSNPDIHMYDLARVEVLNGPQGTLYGASSQSGTIKLVTNKADPSAFDFGLDVSYSDISSGTSNDSIEGYVNIPLIRDKTALRLVLWNSNYGGFIDNTPGTLEYGVVDGATGETVSINNDTVVEDNYNTSSTQGFRAQILHNFSDDWSMILSGFNQKDTRKGSWTLDPEKDGYETTVFDKDYGANEMWQIAATVNGTLGDWASLTYAGSIFNRKYLNSFDWSRPPSDVIARATCESDLDTSAPYRSYMWYDLRIEGYTWNWWSEARKNFRNCGDPGYTFETDAEWDRSNHELRIQSNSDGRFQWIAGVFYQDLDLFYTLHGYSDGIKNENLNSWNWDRAQWQSENWRTDEETAVFGEASLEMGDWTLTLGGRYFWDETTIEIITYPTAGFYTLVPEPFYRAFPGKTDDFLSKVNLAWQVTDDFMLYVLRSEGYRQGGPNRAPDEDVPPTYDPDFLVNYEFGWKSILFDGRVRFNGAYSQKDWDDFQTTRLDLAISSFSFVDNVGKATIKGLELDTQFVITEALTWTLNFAKYESDVEENYAALNPLVPGSGLPWVPSTKVSSLFNYNYDLPGDWRGYARFSSSYSGARLVRLQRESMIETDRQQTDSYLVHNLFVGAYYNQWQVELFIRNLTNEKTELFINTGTNFVTTHNPRTVGLKLAFRY